MKICVKCPQCGHSLMLSAQAADRRIWCSHCYRQFKVPSLDELGNAIKTVKECKGSVFVDGEGKFYG